MWRKSRVFPYLCWWLAMAGVTSGWRPLSAAQAAGDDLKIVIIDGEGFTNNLKKRIAREPVVEVRDRNDKPVAGAVVIFTLPSSGPGGTFANGAQVFRTVTGPDGRATAQAFRANNVTGQFRIEVNATSAGRTATAAIVQTNAAAAGAGMGTGAVLAIVGAAAAATAITLVKVLGTGGKTTTVGVGGPTTP
jgi:hypothetical protein